MLQYHKWYLKVKAGIVSFKKWNIIINNKKIYTHSPFCHVQWVGFRKELWSLNRKMRKTNPTAKKFATKKLTKPFLHLTKWKPLRVCPSRLFLPKPTISSPSLSLSQSIIETILSWICNPCCQSFFWYIGSTRKHPNRPSPVRNVFKEWLTRITSSHRVLY